MHDPDKTVAIICGASQWPHLNRFAGDAAFRNTAKGVEQYLAGRAGMGLAASNILNLFDSTISAVEHFDRIRAFLLGHMDRLHSRDGRGMLVLVAYIGHGAFFEGQRFYCLLLRETHEPAPVESSMRVTVLAHTLRSTAPRSARIVILDSCFAGHAANDFQGAVEEVAAAKVDEIVEQEARLDRRARESAGQIERILGYDSASGVALLCASSSRDPARLAGKGSFTLFGRALIDVLEVGDRHRPGPMSLRQICGLIAARLESIRDAPAPQVHSPEQDGGRDLADAPLFPNPAGPPRPLPGVERRRRQRQLTRAAVAVAVLAAVGISTGGGARFAGHDPGFLRGHCGTEITTLISVGAECIGLTDGSFDLFQPVDRDEAVENRIRSVENTIAAQNRLAEQRHREHPDRPYVTLVDLEALTAPEGGTAAGLTAERESLEGLAVAQNLQLDAEEAGAPLIRVLIGNAGRDMQSGPRLAAQIADSARKDPSIVGVIGLNLSNQATKNTVAVLNDARIPTVATTLSFDYLADWIPLFVQVAPQDRSEAATAAGFAAQLGTSKRVRIYYSGDPNDLYSANLRDDAAYWFEKFGFTVQTTAFTPAGQGTDAQQPRPGDRLIGDAAAAGADNCSIDGIAFFAARGVPDFGTFLDGVASCGGTDATVIGGDDVTRHVADPAARYRTPSVPYYFMSFTPVPETDPEPGPARDFHARLNTLFPFEKDGQRSLDGHAALTFDATQVYVAAVTQLHRNGREISAAALSRQITKLGSFQGVTGTFDYGDANRPNVPRHKPVTVMRVRHGDVDPEIQAYCGELPGRRRSPEPWCPPDADENPPTPPR